MLRDDAIRKGLLKPTQEDIDRMNLNGADIPRPDQVFDSPIENEGFLEDMTYKELAKKAEEMGIELPPQYMKKTALIDLIRAQL